MSVNTSIESAKQRKAQNPPSGTQNTAAPVAAGVEVEFDSEPGTETATEASKNGQRTTPKALTLDKVEARIEALDKALGALKRDPLLFTEDPHFTVQAKGKGLSLDKVLESYFGVKAPTDAEKQIQLNLFFAANPELIKQFAPSANRPIDSIVITNGTRINATGSSRGLTLLSLALEQNVMTFRDQLAKAPEAGSLLLTETDRKNAETQITGDEAKLSQVRSAMGVPKVLERLGRLTRELNTTTDISPALSTKFVNELKAVDKELNDALRDSTDPKQRQAVTRQVKLLEAQIAMQAASALDNAGHDAAAWNLAKRGLRDIEAVSSTPDSASDRAVRGLRATGFEILAHAAAADPEITKKITPKIAESLGLAEQIRSGKTSPELRDQIVQKSITLAAADIAWLSSNTEKSIAQTRAAGGTPPQIDALTRQKSSLDAHLRTLRGEQPELLAALYGAAGNRTKQEQHILESLARRSGLYDYNEGITPRIVGNLATYQDISVTTGEVQRYSDNALVRFGQQIWRSGDTISPRAIPDAKKIADALQSDRDYKSPDQVARTYSLLLDGAAIAIEQNNKDKANRYRQILTELRPAITDVSLLARAQYVDSIFFAQSEAPQASLASLDKVRQMADKVSNPQQRDTLIQNTALNEAGARLLLARNDKTQGDQVRDLRVRMEGRFGNNEAFVASLRLLEAQTHLASSHGQQAKDAVNELQAKFGQSKNQQVRSIVQDGLQMIEAHSGNKNWAEAKQAAHEMNQGSSVEVRSVSITAASLGGCWAGARFGKSPAGAALGCMVGAIGGSLLVSAALDIKSVIAGWESIRQARESGVSSVPNAEVGFYVTNRVVELLPVARVATFYRKFSTEAAYEAALGQAGSMTNNALVRQVASNVRAQLTPQALQSMEREEVEQILKGEFLRILQTDALRTVNKVTLAATAGRMGAGVYTQLRDIDRSNMTTEQKTAARDAVWAETGKTALLILVMGKVSRSGSNYLNQRIDARATNAPAATPAPAPANGVTLTFSNQGGVSPTALSPVAPARHAAEGGVNPGILRMPVGSAPALQPAANGGLNANGVATNSVGSIQTATPAATLTTGQIQTFDTGTAISQAAGRTIGFGRTPVKSEVTLGVQRSGSTLSVTSQPNGNTEISGLQGLNQTQPRVIGVTANLPRLESQNVRFAGFGRPVTRPAAPTISLTSSNNGVVTQQPNLKSSQVTGAPASPPVMAVGQTPTVTAGTSQPRTSGGGINVFNSAGAGGGRTGGPPRGSASGQQPETWSVPTQSGTMNFRVVGTHVSKHTNPNGQWLPLPGEQVANFAQNNFLGIKPGQIVHFSSTGPGGRTGYFWRNSDGYLFASPNYQSNPGQSQQSNGGIGFVRSAPNTNSNPNSGPGFGVGAPWQGGANNANAPGGGQQQSRQGQQQQPPPFTPTGGRWQGGQQGGWQGQQYQPPGQGVPPAGAPPPFNNQYYNNNPFFTGGAQGAQQQPPGGNGAPGVVNSNANAPGKAGGGGSGGSVGVVKGESNPGFVTNLWQNFRNTLGANLGKSGANVATTGFKFAIGASVLEVINYYGMKDSRYYKLGWPRYFGYLPGFSTGNALDKAVDTYQDAEKRDAAAEAERNKRAAAAAASPTPSPSPSPSPAPATTVNSGATTQPAPPSPGATPKSWVDATKEALQKRTKQNP